MSGGLSYRDTGVDRATAAAAKDRIGELVRSTFIEGGLSEPGSFGGLFRLPEGLDPPALVASADGVGTKLKVAIRAGKHDTVGHDLVNHSVDDILVEGARPLFFLDYIGMGELEAGVAEEIVAGIAFGCRENGCALLGGETAEMPDFYAPGEYDLAGLIVGVVEEEKRIGPQRVRAGDQLIGIASNGFHTNGYSLVRRVVFQELGLEIDDTFPGTDESVADVLLRVHRSYLDSLFPLIDAGEIHALAHITGGGIPDNLERVLPGELDAKIDRSTWSIPVEFSTIMEGGRVELDEMFRTFNVGVGMIAIVAPDRTDQILSDLDESGERAWVIGEVVEGTGEVSIG